MYVFKSKINMRKFSTNSSQSVELWVLQHRIKEKPIFTIFFYLALRMGKDIY